METDEIEGNALGLSPDWYRQEQVQEVPPEEPGGRARPQHHRRAGRSARPPGRRGCARGARPASPRGLEEGKLEGLQQGHQAGLEQGREEGLAMGRDQVEAGGGPLASTRLRLATPLSELDDAVEQQLITLVQQLRPCPYPPRGRDLARLLLEALKQGLALLPAAETGVTLMLHPEDLARIERPFECRRVRPEALAAAERSHPLPRGSATRHRTFNIRSRPLRAHRSTAAQFLARQRELSRDLIF